MDIRKRGPNPFSLFGHTQRSIAGERRKSVREIANPISLGIDRGFYQISGFSESD
jgi:hypothetical protein